jgi:polyphosphate kinase
MDLISEEFYNRDLSWLRFNHRVLQEAADLRNPLYERLKFLAIFSSNLDEFFKVRVSDIRQIKHLDKSIRKKLITKPNKLLRRIKKEVHEQQEWFGSIYRNDILPSLNHLGIHLIDDRQYTDTQKDFAKSYYESEIKNKILIVERFGQDSQPLYVENEQLYLIGLNTFNKIIWVHIHPDFDRFVEFPSSEKETYITFVDDIIRYNLKQIYGFDFYAIKASRDAELYIENEYSGDLLEKIKSSLPNRNTGQMTRVLFDMEMPYELMALMQLAIDVNETDMVPGARYHNFKDFFNFPNPIGHELEFEPLSPITKTEYENSSCMFDLIRVKDRLFYFPYESFSTVIRFFKDAAMDDRVTKIKVTLYRISKESEVAAALLEAVKQGKDVTVFIETKARFDEANNIYWGNLLEDAGAQVHYSSPGIKVHSKICYIQRLEGDHLVEYGYIGTGNFNEQTAKFYTDIGLMTSKKKLVNDLAQVFQVLEQEIIIPKTKRLIVSPYQTRTTFMELIEKEIMNAKQGLNAYIILKMNNLQDPKMIKLLYKANNAGVTIRLLIRGICCLVPGIKGQSEFITVTSIVDRFLEHARVYIFANGGDEVMLFGSADWMTRNLDHRIEVLAPILDEDHQKFVRKTINLQLDDHIKARVIDKKQKNDYVDQDGEDKSSQHQIYQFIQEN